MPQRVQPHPVRIQLIRLLAGVLIAAVSFQWSTQLPSQTWLFPFPFLVIISLLTTWVSGPPWGWVVTPGWMVAQSGGVIARAVAGPLTWHYHGDLAAAVLGQGETLGVTVVFVLLAAVAGLCAWGSAALLRRIACSRRAPARA